MAVPTIVYATLADLKTRMRLTDTSEDNELTDKLTTASRDVDSDCGRPHGFGLDPAPVARMFNPQYRIVPAWDGEKLLVDDIGDLTGLIVEVGSGVNWISVIDYDLGPDNALTDGRAVEWLLRPYLPWVTWPRQRVRITARWGWPSVPANIKEATLLRAQRLARRKDSPEGVAGHNDFGVMRVSRKDPDYAALISNYQKPAIG